MELADPLPERRLAWLLGGFIAAGLAFMVLPGTLLGVWNLLGISSRRSAEAASGVWIQAHGHAQIFGWIGSFILGIGFHSIPRLRRDRPLALVPAWICWLAAKSALAPSSWAAGKLLPVNCACVPSAK